MGSVILGGIKGFLDYKASSAPVLNFDLDYFRYFTKDYIQRRYAWLATEKLPENTELPTFRIFADEQDLESLSSNLPSSGKTRYISGHLQSDTPVLESEILFRYRGGLPLHWLYKKKSLRIKLPPYTTYRGERKFNLVNPSDSPTVTDMVSYDISRSLGLLTPEYFPARVYINNNYNGLHFFLSQVDESLLRKNRRMPGSVYSGDTIYVPNPFGKNIGITEMTFKDGNIPILWKDERLWQKDASRNAESAKDRRDIRKFIDIINASDQVEFLNAFESYFDREKFYSFWGLDTLFGSYHHDYFHNHKIYFDPYKGKFEPVEWDIRYWSSYFRSKDLIVTPLLRQVKLNPILEYERDLLGYNLMKKYTVDDVVNRIERAKEEVEEELAADPYRQYPDQYSARFAKNKEIFLSMKQFRNDIEKLKKVYEQRYAYLNGVYENSIAEYKLSPHGSNGVEMTVSIDGNSPVNFDPWQIIPVSLRPGVKIIRSFQSMHAPVSEGESVKLYPGRKTVKGNSLGRADNWTLMAFGEETLAVSPMHYRFIIDNVKLTDIKGFGELITANAITGSKVSIKPAEMLADDSDTESLHPWTLLREGRGSVEKIKITGDINVLEDRVYAKNQQVVIEPGTTFRMAKGRSLIFYGKVTINGTQENPVIFKPLVDGQPWGSIVIQGASASGSSLKHVQVSGGSVTTQRLISYPGQLNIHDVDTFVLENCLISNNKIGDDSLHVAYSKGRISNCQFESTAFDALDMDISEVTVSGSRFHNIGNDALDVMTSSIEIYDVEVDGAGDKCISVGEASKVRVVNSKLNHCQIGIAVKDESEAYMEDIEFYGNKESAISLYRKNARYSSGGVIDGMRLHGISEKDISLDKDSASRLTADAFLPIKNNIQ